MHLEVIQNSGVTELVNSETIEKLYNLSFSDPSNGIVSILDNASDLQGRLELYATYEDYVTYLRNIYPNLIINTTTYYFRFKDAVFGNICATLFGDGIGATQSELSSVINFSNNFKSAVEGATNLLYIDLRGFSGLNVWGDMIFRNIDTLKGVYIKNFQKGLVLNFCSNCGIIKAGDSKPTLNEFIIDGVFLKDTDLSTDTNIRFLMGMPGNPQNFGTIAIRRIAPRRSWDPSSSTYYYAIGDYLTREINITNFYLGEQYPERVRLNLGWGDNINKIPNFYVPLGCALAYANSSTWSVRTGETPFLEYDFENDPNHIFG